MKNLIVKWQQRAQKLEQLARETEKSLIEGNKDAHLDLGKIARIMILSARAHEIEICVMELKEIFTCKK